MACPDRKKDARIIAEYKKRKLPSENTIILTESTIFEGDLFSIIHTIELINIISIIKAGDNSWEITTLILEQQ